MSDETVRISRVLISCVEKLLAVEGYSPNGNTRKGLNAALAAPPAPPAAHEAPWVEHDRRISEAMLPPAAQPSEGWLSFAECIAFIRERGQGEMDGACDTVADALEHHFSAQPSNALSNGFDEALFDLARKDDYMGIYLEMRKRLIYIGKHDGSAEIVDLSPAMRDGAIRDRLIEFGWSPPA